MKNCECCKKSYSTGKSYGDSIHQFSDMTFTHEVGWKKMEGLINKTEGLCPFCNPKHILFCCLKHNYSFKIGHTIYNHS